MTKANNRGWLALSPLFVFLLVYLVSSIVAHDFYKVPVASAFMIASIYAIAVTPGMINDRVNVFSNGATDPNILMMIWIFILAGAFASCAKAIGSVEATVDLTLRILPGKLLLAGLFLAACFISMSIGTSVGTVVALVPIASGLAPETGLPLPMLVAIIVGGAFFGDNLSFISDTTIAATRTQGCSMSDKFKANIWIALPAAVVVAIVYMVIGMNVDTAPSVDSINPIKLIPYLSVIVLAICGMNVMAVLCIGIALCALLGFLEGIGWISLLGHIGSGIGDMGELITVTLLAGGMLGLIRHNGGIDLILKGLTKGIKGKKGAEFSIGGLVALTNLCTANNTISIITIGPLAKDISQRYGVDPRKSASIMDTFSCIAQGFIPYGAQLLMASGLAGISSVSIIQYLYYPFALLACACLAIVFRFPKKYS